MQLNVTVKLFAILRIGRFQERLIPVDEGSTIADLITLLKIPQQDVAFFLRNGKRAELHECLADGDVLSLFPLIGGG